MDIDNKFLHFFENRIYNIEFRQDLTRFKVVDIPPGGLLYPGVNKAANREMTQPMFFIAPCGRAWGSPQLKPVFTE